MRKNLFLVLATATALVLAGCQEDAKHAVTSATFNEESSEQTNITQALENEVPDLSQDSENDFTPTPAPISTKEPTPTTAPTSTPTPTSTPIPTSTPTPTCTPTPTATPLPLSETDASVFQFEQKEDGTIRIIGLKDTSLKAIRVPKEIYGFTVTEISSITFYECENLVHIELPDSLRGGIGLSVPSTVTTLKLPKNEYITSVAISNYMGESIELPNSVEYLRLECPNLDKVTIPSSVKEINITSEKIEDINIPDSVTMLILDCNNLSNVTMGKNISALSIRSEKIETIQVPDNITELILYCDNLINIDVPKTVSTLFVKSKKIESIDIPLAVTDLELWCSNLKSLVVPENVVNLELTCSNLESLIVPRNVEDLSLSCGNLNEIRFMGTVADLYLGECNNIRRIYFPDEMDLETLNLRNLKLLESIDIPKGVKEVNLSGCSSLKAITLPEGVTRLNLSACTSLTNVEIPSGVISVDMRNCKSLTKIKIPEGVTSAHFENCTSLTDIVLASSLRTYVTNWNGSYGEYKCYAYFSGCSNLTTVTIPFQLYYNELDDIFGGCPKLAVLITNDVNVTNWAVFKGYSVLKYVPEE